MPRELGHAYCKLSDFGFKVGDFVTANYNDECTGGVVYVISESGDEMVIDSPRRTVAAVYELHGYVRLRPVFSFFPSSRGGKPRGKGGTILLHLTDYYYNPQAPAITKVDLVTVATKYAELGNLVRDVAAKGGMNDGTAPQEKANNAHESPQE